MTISRYSRTPRIKGGRQFGTARESNDIYNATRDGTVSSYEVILKGDQRLDIIAGRAFDDSSLWWIIAAASGIGWGLQVPAGTVLRIPDNLDDVERIIG